jgi:hypothetical protein
MRILLPGNLTKKTASEKNYKSVGRVFFSGSFLNVRFRFVAGKGQTFFVVIMTKTPLLMGFLVYELNCHRKNSEKY